MPEMAPMKSYVGKKPKPSKDEGKKPPKQKAQKK
jgi:hypothetical protein